MIEVRRLVAGAAVVGAALLLPSAALAAQGSIAERLRDRVPADVVAAVERLAAEAAAQGLPVEPLVQKAIEGGAKGVPAPRVVAALEALTGRLASAARAARAGGVETPDAPTIEAGAFALGTGIGEPGVTRLIRASQPPHNPGSSLRVAAALAALGVPSAQTVDLVVQAMEAGQPVADVLTLPARVQAGIGRGLSPAEAAGQARGRGHQRPGGVPRGRPESRPPHPQGPPNPPDGVT